MHEMGCFSQVFDHTSVQAADLDNSVIPYEPIEEDEAAMALSWSLRAMAHLPGSFLKHLPQNIRYQRDRD